MWSVHRHRCRCINMATGPLSSCQHRVIEGQHVPEAAVAQRLCQRHWQASGDNEGIRALLRSGPLDTAKCPAAVHPRHPVLPCRRLARLLAFALRTRSVAASQASGLAGQHWPGDSTLLSPPLHEPPASLCSSCSLCTMPDATPFSWPHQYESATGTAIEWQCSCEFVTGGDHKCCGWELENVGDQWPSSLVQRHVSA